LEELKGIALENNLSLKVIHQNYLAALERAPQTGQLPDPEIGVGVFPLPVETRLGAQLTRLSATQMFPWKGTLDSQKDLELAKAKVLAEQSGVEALNIFYQIEKAYFILFELQQSQIILQRNLPLLQSFERLALTKVETGKGNAADVLRVQLKIEELNQQLQILKNQEIEPISTINQLLNRDLNIPIQTVEKMEFAKMEYENGILLDTIEKNHPLLKMYVLRQAVSNQAIRANSIGAKPSFGVGLDYILVNGRNDATPTGNGRDIVQVRVSMKVPLNKDKYDAKEREEELKISALEDERSYKLSQMMSTINKAFANHKTAQLQVDLYQKQIEITKAAIRILESTYSASGLRFDELLSLEKELIEYDLKILKAIVQSHLTKCAIEQFINS